MVLVAARQDDDLVVARKLFRSGSDGLGGDKAADLGFVGTPQSINTDALDTLLDAGLVPVIAPIGVGASDRQTYNINADTVAGAVASAVGASRRPPPRGGLARRRLFVLCQW